jgi:DNA-binding transcriptional regulator YiaG
MHTSLPDAASKLNNLLWLLNITNNEAAEVLGVSSRTVYRWLAGTTKVPASAIRLLEITLSLRKPVAKV